MIGGIFCLLMAAINVPFIAAGTGGWWNVASLVFCSAMAGVCFGLWSKYR